MSWIDPILYLIALPLSVWMLANILSVFDLRPITPPLIRLLLTILGIALFLTLTHREYLTPILLAFVTVLTLHALSGWLLRHTLGSPSYESSSGKIERTSEDDLDEDDIEEIILEKK